MAFQQATTISTTTGDLTLDPTAELVVTLTDNDISGFLLQNANGVYYDIDTRRSAVSGIIVHQFRTPTITVASGATNTYTGISFSSFTLNYTGTTQVTNAQTTVDIGACTIAGDTATLTVDQANGLAVRRPIEGTNISITDAATIRVVEQSGAPTNSYGLYIENLTAGTNDYGIYVVGADTLQLWMDGTTPSRFDGNVWVGATAGFSTAGTNNIVLLEGTAPSGTLTDGGAIYVRDAAAVTELTYVDSGGTVSNVT